MALSAGASVSGMQFARQASMFGHFVENIAQDLNDNKEVGVWLNGLKRDPLIKTTSSILSEADFAFRTALNVSSSLLHAALFPITYPLSKIVKKRQPTLSELPFPASRSFNFDGPGQMIEKKLNVLQKSSLAVQNFGANIALSKSLFVRVPISLANNLISIPLKYISEPTKEQLVMMAIQNYFPAFNTAEFHNWLEQSFTPVLIERYLRGNITKLTEVAEAQVTKERQMNIADYVVNGYRIRSRLLSVYDVEIVDFQFTNSLPVVNVRCYADHTDEITTSKGHPVSGGPDQIKRTEFMLVLTINTDKDTPVWKCKELMPGRSNSRI